MIINFDDLGYSKKLNTKIFQAMVFLPSSTASLMVNMPAFDDAIEEINYLGLKGRIGIHLNCTEGRSLTGIKFRNNHKQFLSKEERKEIAYEFNIQLLKFAEDFGRPSHIDTHHHFHYKFSGSSIVRRLAKEFNIPVRTRQNIGNRTLRDKILSAYLNYRLGDLRRTEYYCNTFNAKNKLEVGIHL